MSDAKNSALTLLKRVWRTVYQFVQHNLDAFYSHLRYLRFSNSFHRSARDRQKLEALLFFYYHKIEKALALPEVKPLFGLGYIETVLDLMERWDSLTGDRDAVVFRGGYASLVRYHTHVGEALAQARPALARRIDKFLADYERPEEDLSAGGTRTITAATLQTCSGTLFEHFVDCRHSVRNFTERHVPDNEIVQAVRLAQRSPSVCNRQCWRVHVFTSEHDKGLVLHQQNGNAGFGHLADRVLLITADLRAFISTGERHQAYVDGGMFAMTLVYALLARGIASCCLNVCHSSSQDLALRRVCKIPKWEVPVMMIVVGYPPDSLQVAVSARKLTESMLFFRSLGSEAPIGAE